MTRKVLTISAPKEQGVKLDKCSSKGLRELRDLMRSQSELSPESAAEGLRPFLTIIA